MGNAIKNISFYGFLILFIAFVSACQCETPTEAIIDEPPTITNHVFIVLETASNGTPVGTVNASDDVGIITSYSITDGNTSNAFAINNSGLLTKAATLNYGTKSNYSLIVQVADFASNTASNTVTVNVMDVIEGLTRYITNTINITNDQDINALAANTIINDLKPKMFVWLDVSVGSLFSLNTNGRLTNWVDRKGYQIITNFNLSNLSVSTNTNTEIIDNEQVAVTNIIYSNSNDITYSLSSAVSAKPKSDISANNSLIVSNGYVSLDYEGNDRVGFAIDTASINNNHNITAFYFVTKRIGENNLWYPVLGYNNLGASNRFLTKQSNTSSYAVANGADGKGDIVLGDSTFKRNQLFTVPSGNHLLSRRGLSISKSQLNGVLGSFPVNNGHGGGQQVRELIIFTNTVSDTDHSNMVKYLFDKWNIHREPVTTNLYSFYSASGNNVLQNARDGNSSTYFQGNQSAQRDFVSNRVIFEYAYYGSVLSADSLSSLVSGLSTSKPSIRLITGQNVNGDAIKAPFRVEILRTNDFQWYALTNVATDTNNGTKTYYFYLLHPSNDYFGYRLVANGPASGVGNWFTIDEFFPSVAVINSPRVVAFTNAVANNKIYQTNGPIFSNGFTNYLYFDQKIYGLVANDFTVINGTVTSITAISGNSNYTVGVRPHSFSGTNSNTVIQSPNLFLSLGANVATNATGGGNAASDISLAFVPKNALAGFDVGTRSSPTFGDLDGDGDLDMVSGENDGFFRFYRNDGNATNPNYSFQVGTTNPLNGFDVGDRSSPTFGDLDGDGDLDMLSGEKTGIFNFYLNTSNVSNATFSEQTGSANPFNGLDVGFVSTPIFVDLDGDGDMDMVSGKESGSFKFYLNTGDAANATYTEQGGTNNPLNGLDVGLSSSPTFGDLDGDGDMDMLSGEETGSFHFYRNDGNVSNASFSEQTGSINPFNGFNVGLVSVPTFVDLDGDGDMDMIGAGFNGGFNFYMNIGGVFVQGQ